LSKENSKWGRTTAGLSHGYHRDYVVLGIFPCIAIVLFSQFAQLIAMKSKLVALLFLFSAKAVFGWSIPGHELIAKIAYDNLTTEAKSEIAKILKENPAYEEWEERKPDDIDMDQWAFIQSAAFPDDIKKSGYKNDIGFEGEVHKPWHFVNFPWDESGIREHPIQPTMHCLVSAQA